MRENGLQSWQMYSQKRGVTLRLKFNEAQNGGHSLRTDSDTNRIAFCKKSPSQIKRDNKKATERRQTRQQSRALQKKDESEIEHPRGEQHKSMTSPLLCVCSPVLPVVDISDSSHAGHKSSLNDHNGQSEVGHSMERLSSKAQTADHTGMDLLCSTPVSLKGAAKTETVTDDADSTDTETDEDEHQRGFSMDSNMCEFGHNLSLPIFRYQYMRPRDRRCTYCGVYKGRYSKVIYECEKDGRKICLRCYPDTHRRHRKYFKECTTNYVNDGDCD